MKTYKEVAKFHNLSQKNLERFVKYMITRWPEEEERYCVTGYAETWAFRFRAGLEYDMSDPTGIKVLQDIDHCNI